MTNSVIQSLKNIFWFGMKESVLKDVSRDTFNNENFKRNLINGRDITIHLRRKHFSSVVEETVNEMFSNQHYAVTSMKYRFLGMDVFVSRK